jgi:hypothetical protein
MERMNLEKKNGSIKIIRGAVVMALNIEVQLSFKTRHCLNSFWRYNKW